MVVDIHFRSFHPSEMEFIAEHEKVTIIPTHKIPQLELISGIYGPFLPPKKYKVPLWLAVFLKKRQKCHVKAPDFLDVDYLKERIVEEQSKDELTNLPYHYAFIAEVLLENAVGDIPRKETVHKLLKDLREIRQTKFKTLVSQKHPCLTNMSSVEVVELQPFLTQSCFEQWKLHQLKIEYSTQTNADVKSMLANSNLEFLKNVSSSQPVDSSPSLDLTAQEVLSNLPASYYPLRDDDIDEHASILFQKMLIKFFAAALVSPIEIAQILLQVQYLPKRSTSDLTLLEESKDKEHHRDLHDDWEELDEVMGASELAPLTTQDVKQQSQAKRDYLGYLVCDNADDDSLRPSYQLAPVRGGGIRDMLKALWNHNHEGLPSLFKAIHVSWMYDMGESMLRNKVESMAEDFVSLDLEEEPLPFFCKSFFCTVLSHSLVGFVLSPLDIVKTRMIVQTAHPTKRTYSGMFDAFRKIIQEEGGVYNLYFATTRLGATILYHFVHSTFKFLGPWIIESIFGVTSERPILYAFLELMLSTMDTLICLPISTCLRRLQCQTVYPNSGFQLQARNSSQSLHSVVPLCQQKPYFGFRDCLTRIVREENCLIENDKDLEVKPTQTSFIPKISPGIWSLYPGLRMHLVSNLLMFGISSLSSDIDISEWEEYE